MTKTSVLQRLMIVAAGLATVLGTADSDAVGTRRFELYERGDFEGGDLKGVAVDSTGKVRAGLNLGEVPVSEGNSIWTALRLGDGSVLLGTGNEGKLLRLEGTKVSVVAETKALVVTSLVRGWGGAVIVGTMPDGKVMKWAAGKLSELVTLKGTEHVWQVAFDPKTNSVFAATGPEGKLWRIDANGQAQVYFDSEEQHLMSVAVAADGTVYAGASDKAKLYKITGPGRAAVLHDFGRTEVRAIVVGRQREVYVIANDITRGSSTPSRATSTGTAPAGPARVAPKTKGKGVLVRFSPDGAPEQLLEDDDEHFVSLALGDDGRPFVGTGVEGRVYSVGDAHSSVLVADTEERQVGALLMAGKTRLVAASDPAVVHPVRGVGGIDAVWTSKVFDAGIRARFGRISWVVAGTLELSTRTGNGKEPDETWSDWSKPIVAPGVVQSPAARFLQVRARWNRDPDAVLSEVQIPFVTDNLRALVTSIDAESAAKKSASSSTGIQSSGGPISKEAEPKVKLSWKVDNDDKDELRYRLQYRLVGTTTWYDMLKPKEKLTSTSYTWETADLPEGRYRVRVIATDEFANPPDRVKKHQLDSSVVLVDNTAPAIEELRVVGRRVQGTVLDGVGPIERIEVSVVGTGEWYPFFPKDGVFDEQREEFDADVSPFAPQRPALLTVRAYDRANNAVVRSVPLK